MESNSRRKTFKTREKVKRTPVEDTKKKEDYEREGEENRTD